LEKFMATPITSVPRIGEATAFALSQHGYKSAEDLAIADEESLAAVPGFGVNRAAAAIKAAQALVGDPASAAEVAPSHASEPGEPPTAEEEEKTSGKKKKKKKKSGEASKSSKKNKGEKSEKGKKKSKKGKKKSGKG
jgi:hypothetical protein